MRLALLCVMFSTAGCNLLADQQSNFALVLTEEAKVEPSLVYGCVDRWIQFQDIMVLTSEVGRIQGWNGDKNPIFCLPVHDAVAVPLDEIGWACDEMRYQWDKQMAVSGLARVTTDIPA